MENYLIFNLYGPMASWGDIAVGEIRHSDPHPTKSAILGLCAAALGIKRDDEDELQKLNDSLIFGVCELRKGQFLRDYHTIQIPSAADLKKRPHFIRRHELLVPDLNTIISKRDYYCDALYLVILKQTENGSIKLEKIQQSLKRPKFILYLGRKSCPLALPALPKIITSNSIENVIDEYCEQEDVKILMDDFLKEAGSTYHLFTEQEFKNQESEGSKIRKDKLLNRQAWQYTDRKEFVYSIKNRRRN